MAINNAAVVRSSRRRMGKSRSRRRSWKRSSSCNHLNANELCKLNNSELAAKCKLCTIWPNKLCNFIYKHRLSYIHMYIYLLYIYAYLCCLFNNMCLCGCCRCLIWVRQPFIRTMWWYECGLHSYSSHSVRLSINGNTCLPLPRCCLFSAPCSLLPARIAK